MSVLNDNKPVKLFFSVFSQEQKLVDDVARKLSDMYGPFDSETPLTRFEYTGYYKKEFGVNLVRKLFSVSTLIDASEAVEIKLKAAEMEKELSSGGKRSINIDPGYVELSRVVLTTGKDYAHRIYIGRGVYGDLTLVYKKDEGYVTLPWTYPDYGSEEFRTYFKGIRNILKKQLKEREID